MTEEADDRAPNWSIWKHLPRMKLYESVALSLNIDPLELRHHPQAWMTGGPGRPVVPFFLEGQQFQERWSVAQRSLGSNLPGPINWPEHRHGAPPEVRLAAFARWARSVEWEMPVELF
jgi:hypothetical protein